MEILTESAPARLKTMRTSSPCPLPLLPHCHPQEGSEPQPATQLATQLVTRPATRPAAHHHHHLQQVLQACSAATPHHQGYHHQVVRQSTNTRSGSPGGRAVRCRGRWCGSRGWSRGNRLWLGGRCRGRRWRRRRARRRLCSRLGRGFGRGRTGG